MFYGYDINLCAGICYSLRFHISYFFICDITCLLVDTNFDRSAVARWRCCWVLKEYLVFGPVNLRKWNYRDSKDIGIRISFISKFQFIFHLLWSLTTPLVYQRYGTFFFVTWIYYDFSKMHQPCCAVIHQYFCIYTEQVSVILWISR